MSQKLSRYYRVPPFQVTKTVTFTGAANNGAADSAVAIFTVTGDVLVSEAYIRCVTDITSAGAPVFDYGIVGSDNLFVDDSSTTDMTAWDAGEFFDANQVDFLSSASSLIRAAFNLDTIAIRSSVIFTPRTAAVTGGSLVFYLQWSPLSPGATVTPAT